MICRVLCLGLLALTGVNPASGMDVSSLLDDLAHSSYDDSIDDISSQIDELEGSLNHARKRHQQHAHHHHRAMPRFRQKALAKAQLKRALAKKLHARVRHPSLSNVNPALIEMVRERITNKEREAGHKYFGHPTHWSEMTDREKVLYGNLLPPMPPSQADLDAKKEQALADSLKSSTPSPTLLETAATAKVEIQAKQVADAVPAFSLPNAPAGGNAPNAPGLKQPWKSVPGLYPEQGAPPPAPNQMAAPGSLQKPLPQFMQVPANPQGFRQDTVPLYAPHALPQFTAAGQQVPVQNSQVVAQAASMNMARFQQMLNVQAGNPGSGMQRGPMPSFASDPKPPVRESAFGAVLEQNLGQPQSTPRSMRYGAAASPAAINDFNRQTQQAYPFGAY